MSYTINPNAKNKWARNAENTMDLSLETDASSVYLDNGRTLEQELGEGSMVSNVATVDSSMSKIIDGTLNGAYESCVLKGITKFIDNTGKILDSFVENRDLSLIDCKSPILSNVGKNLFNYQGEELSGYHSNDFNDGRLVAHSGVNSYMVEVQPNTTYTLSYNNSSALGLSHICYFNENKVYIRGEVDKKDYLVRTITTPLNTKYLSFPVGKTVTNIQMEIGSAATPYEPYKTNILHTPEIVTLRSLPNGVRDELNLKTGEYVQRIDEVVLDGSESWSVNNSNNEGFYSASTTTYVGKPKGDIISDKLPTITTTKAEGVMMGVSTGKVMVSFNRDSTGVSNINLFVEKLAQNPITVQYELATPITTTIETLSIPFTYENGHIVLESGYEGQSLLPTLEYSTVINRTGQIQSIANTVQKQEKQITKLEQMLIQNIVDLDYNNTLLTLKNEMEEML